MTEGAVDAAKAQPLALHEWADLPLHRVVATAAVHRSGTLHPVGAVAEKANRAAMEPGVVALAVHQDQRTDVPWADKAAGKPSVIGATTLGWLANELAARAGAAAYGPVVPLPAVLQQASPDHAGPWQRSFDYRAESYRGLNWLDERVLQALQAPAQASDDATEPPEGVLRKYANRGYIHILATASSGKTSWALNWVRQSTGELPAGPLPPLAGWYFARRQGQGAVEHGSELHALQNLISLARRQRDVLPRAAGAADPPGTPLNLLSKDEADAFHAQPDANHERRLSERFRQALKALTEDSPPSPERPLVFLIDGGDEMWGPGTRFQRWNFPHVLPTMAELPEHVYVVLLSRPGPHMLGFHDKVPLLRYVFAREDVDRSIRDYLNSLAEAWEDKLPGNEATTLLRRSSLADNICNASEGAFGYVTLLMREWLPRWDEGAYRRPIEHDLETLRRWCERPASLPEGIYGLRAEEFLALQDRSNPQTAGAQVSLAEALALVGQLRWPLSRHQLLELLYPGASLYGQEDPLRDSLRDQLRRGSIWLVGSGSDDEHEPMRFGHLSLQETALAAWRLQVLNRRLDRHALAQEARLVAEQDQGDPGDMSPDAVGRRMALAQLHAMLGGALKHTREPAWLECVALKRPPLGPNCMLDEATVYEWVWGPMHAILAGVLAAQRPERLREPPWMGRCRQVRRLLIDAPFLQSAVRAQAVYARKNEVPPQAEALRETYILADRLQGADIDRTLRHRVEAALLQWHDRIAEEVVQVGGMLWNLLGADDNGKVHAQRWKDSIDKPALITTLPGRPSDLMRQIPARRSAVTPCGNWLITSDSIGKTEIWDLSDGCHRAVISFSFPWALGLFEAIAVGDEIGIGGVDSKDSTLLFLARVCLQQGTGVLHRYAGHEREVSSVSLQAERGADCTLVSWALGSGSVDNTVGLLVRDAGQIEKDNQLPQADEPIGGALLRYAGHENLVRSVSLQAERGADGTLVGWALGSGSWDRTVGLLLRDAGQIEQDRRRARADLPIRGALVRYAGHHGSVNSVSLQAECGADGTLVRWVLGSGSEDRTVGLLLRDAGQIEEDRLPHWSNWPIGGALLRYAGHRGSVNSVSLQAECGADGTLVRWVLASGSTDRTVGLLLRKAGQIERDCQRPKLYKPIGGALMRYAGHQGAVTSVSLQAERGADGTLVGWALGSGAWDSSVRLLLRKAGQIKEDRSRLWVNKPIGGALLRYVGHIGEVTSVSLRPKRGADGTLVGWALGCRSSDSTVGLLQIDPGQIERNRQRPQVEKPIGGALLRYAGHQREVTSVSLQAERGADGVLVGWALGSGSWDNTVGLLLLEAGQIEKDRQRPRTNEPIGGALLRYAGHEREVKSVSLQAERGAGGMLVGWALGSGSSDKTVGLLLRDAGQIKKDRCRIRADKPISRALLRYAGHEYEVTSVSLQAELGADGTLVGWALGSGSRDETVGLLLRSVGQAGRDAGQTNKHRWRPEAGEPIDGTMVRYAGHRGSVESVSLQAECGDDGTLVRWVLGSGSEDRTVGLLLRDAKQIYGDRWRNPRDARIGGALLRYSGHKGPVMSVSLQAERGADGTLVRWSLGSGSTDSTIGLLVRDAGQTESQGLTIRKVATGLPGFAKVLGVEVNPSIQPIRSSGRHWLTVSNTAAMIWSCDPAVTDAVLRADAVCPFGHLSGFDAMDFAPAHDGIHYMIGGAVGNDVALMPLELHLP